MIVDDECTVFFVVDDKFILDFLAFDDGWSVDVFAVENCGTVDIVDVVGAPFVSKTINITDVLCQHSVLST